MTASPEAASGDSCLQVFTERYDEFIFGNDTVTAIPPDWDAPKALTAKAAPPTQVKACWQAHSWELWCWQA